MPRIFPQIDSNEIENEGERDVYKALVKQAPKDWIIRYHYSYSWYEGRYLRDGEVDFIVLIPRVGIIFLEVKGSHGYDSRNGKWFRVDKKLAKEETGNPFDQAMGNKHRLISQLCQKLYNCPKGDFPGLYGFAVVYPRGKYEGAIPNSCDPSLMIANKAMGSLTEKLKGILLKSGHPTIGESFTQEVFADAARYFEDRANIVPVLAPEVADDSQTIEALTEFQYRALRGILDNQRLHVKGCAGSGKTLLARWSAEHKASQGKRVLFTCFNRNLASWVKGTASSQSIEVRSFFSICREIVNRAGIRFAPPEQQSTFWAEQAPTMMAEAIDLLQQGGWEGYDAVIVDEAQDFAPNWWFPLQLLLKNPDSGLMQIFSDADQAGLYGSHSAYPPNLRAYELHDNCRNSKRIARFSSELIGQKSQSSALQPNGINPIIAKPVSDALGRAKVVKRIINDLCSEGFSINQIAILSPYSQTSKKSSLGHLGKIQNLDVIGDDKNLSAWQQNRCIWGSTIKAFKGLEADCIILTDMDESTLSNSCPTETYVGTTRAKHVLHVIPTSDLVRDKLSTISITHFKYRVMK